ncbi:MAG TPA: tetratricopeptide repeat protein [Planctomycetota bacterium]|jgi:tetratricopeptide (TPR) repeat protein|nr:tetratricopeptide repeat protein [Planctomycetota bacterium]
MDAVTYPNEESERRLNESFVALRVPFDRNGVLERRWAVSWTPGILVLDSGERVHYRAYGYHPPEEFAHLLGVARGMTEFDAGDFEQASRTFSRVVEDVRRSAMVPEALYWLGVARYKAGDRDGLVRAWSRLLDEHPENLWARRAGFIRAPARAEPDRGGAAAA